MESFSPRVQNKTRAFEVTRARRNLDIDGAGPELSLRNGYDKNITAFAVSVNGLIGQIDFVYCDSEGEAGPPIAPGAVSTRGFGNVRRSVNTAAEPEYDIRVLAVVFDDKTSDGDEKAVASILYNRLRTKRLITGILDVLDGDLNSLLTVDENVLDELSARISHLSSDPANASETSDVLLWLHQSDRGLSPRERIIRVKEICERLVARL